MPKPTRVVAAAAAAIIHPADIKDDKKDPDRRAEPDAARAVPDTGRFVVHPHVEQVAFHDPLLRGYINDIYERRNSVGAAYPSSSTFAKLALEPTLVAATHEVAGLLATKMRRKQANRGIVFGFIIELDNGGVAHGIVKADLDAAQRFHFTREPGGGWSLNEVRDILPPPKQDFAKYIIAPQPGGASAAGVRDESAGVESAAEYLLEAVELRVPRTRGTRARVVNEALNSGYTLDTVRDKLGTVSENAPVADVLEQHFPEVPPGRVERLKGPAFRPMQEVRVDDPYRRVYSTRKPYFRLEADDEVIVERIGERTLHVILPPDSDSIAESAK